MKQTSRQFECFRNAVEKMYREPSLKQNQLTHQKVSKLPTNSEQTPQKRYRIGTEKV